MTLTNDDFAIVYFCPACYLTYRMEIQQTGTSSVPYIFRTEEDAIAHMSDGQFPTHTCAWHSGRKDQVTYDG